MRKLSRMLWIVGLCGVGLAACSDDEKSSKSSKSDDGDRVESSETDGEDEGEESVSRGRDDDSVDGTVSTSSAGASGAGVSLLRPETAGLCRLESPDSSKKTCWDYQPRDVDSLSPGTYVLHARLAVAKELVVPATFDTHCRRSGTDSDLKHRDQTTDVSRGSDEDGYRTHYLTLTVPETTWASDCTWSLSVPDEHGGELASGSWYFTLP
jgi:hypothetical protein